MELGAGELVVTSIDDEGTGKGFELEWTRRVATAVPVPVIAAGGAGQLAHVHEVVDQGQADAVCLAALLHYNVLRHHRATDADYTQEGNTEFLRRGGGFARIQDVQLSDVKRYLIERGLDCRLLPQEAAHV